MANSYIIMFILITDRALSTVFIIQTEISLILTKMIALGKSKRKKNDIVLVLLPRGQLRYFQIFKNPGKNQGFHGFWHLYPEMYVPQTIMVHSL